MIISELNPEDEKKSNRRLFGDIKNPTESKVRRKGFTPVTYHLMTKSVCGSFSGWIYKEDHKWVWFNSPSTGRIKRRITEKQFMREVK